MMMVDDGATVSTKLEEGYWVLENSELVILREAPGVWLGSDCLKTVLWCPTCSLERREIYCYSLQGFSTCRCVTN